MKKQLISESGIRDINNIAKRYKQAKIYFHIDLDGVTSAIAMKVYLESYGIEVVDAETIQYGTDEFAIKKPDASGDVMPVLVDFAHGKPMFKIHTDHHDRQAGVESGTSTSFRHARSNVETISGVISTYDLFPPSDIKIISTIDSANFRAMNITVREVMNYIFKVEKESPERSNIIMGLVTNKILLAFKNKEFEGKNILERLVLDCTPSLKNIYNNLIRMIMDSGLMDKVKGFLNTELGDEEPKGDKIRRIQQQLQKHGETYLEKVRGNIGKQLKYEDGIIIKDGSGGASMANVGSYDRYVAFELIPDADFQVVTWAPVGLLQVSCNPYKESRGLKGVDLGKMNTEILNNHKSELEGIKTTLLRLKEVAESSTKFVPYESVGFTFQDFIALYSEKDENGKVIKDKDGKIINIKGYFDVPEKFKNFANKKSEEENKKKGQKKMTPLKFWQNLIRKTMMKPFVGLTDFEQSILKEVYINAYDVIKNNSGGHKCITNFQASALGGGFGPYKTTAFIGMIKDEFVEKLKNEIQKEKKQNIDENYFRNIINKTILESKSSLKKKYYLDDSQIEGKGVFASYDLSKGEIIGLLHTINELGNDYTFTELGKFHNHSNNPNCENLLIKNKRYLIPIRNIEKGEELTTDYTLQPDLEQPQDNWNKKQYLPHIDGYRTYSPFKNLDYIIINGERDDIIIDCDNIVFDLVLISDTKKVKFCRKNSGHHPFLNVKKVIEIPIKNNTHFQKLKNDKNYFNKWLKNKIEEVDKKGEIKEMLGI